MATIAPPGVTKGMRDTADSEKLLEVLRPWRRRLAIQHMLRWMAGGLILGFILASLLLLISRFVPWASVFYWAGGATLLCFIATLGIACWRRPSLARTARLVDRRLGLQDRLSTAWELREVATPLPLMQRQDALKQLDEHTPARAIPLRPKRSILLTFGIVIAVLALLVVLPNPMTAVLQQQAAFQARVAKQVAAIDQLRQSINQQTSIPAQQRKQIDQILHDTEVKLQGAKNETQAQQILAQAQAKLDQLRDPQAANKAQGIQAASSALQGSTNANLNALGQALASGDKKQLSTALQGIASQAGKLSAAQRAQLAQQIEQAANQSGQNPQMQAALHQLARAVADGNASEIADASRAVQAAADENATSQVQSGSIDQASQGLQQSANTLASATDGSANQNQGQGQGQGKGQGQGQGGQGQGGSGGSNGAGNTLGKHEQVYVPGQIGNGTSTQSNGGNNGVVQQGSSVPYSQVIAQYNQQAHDAIDNSTIPPDMKDLVHGYFDTLEGQ